MGRPADSDRELVQRISARVDRLLRHARSLCSRLRGATANPNLRFDLRGQAAGQFRWQRGERPELRFNLDIARGNADDFVEQTVAHEVAHLVTFACHGRTRPHGPEWRAVMRQLGIADPRRCHDYALDDTALRRQRRWPYRCACRDHLLSTTRHRRQLRGAAHYVCRRCGSALSHVADGGD